GTSNYLAIKIEIQDIVTNQHHFADNNILIKVLIPIIDAIDRLESKDAILANIFKELVKEFDKLLQINVEEVSMDMNNESVVENFFIIKTFEWSQELSEESLNTFSQRHITSAAEDWSNDDIFFLPNYPTLE
ncbi:4306_t:CDS:2, partial [Dentiscutata erythropus]